MRRKWQTRAIALLALALLVVAFFGLWLNYRPLPFDPVRWREGEGMMRGRMLGSLLAQTDFVGFARVDVERYIGAPDFDERQFWYDLGPEGRSTPVDPRADVGEATRLYGVFAHDRAGTVTEVLYNHRRPLLGSALFDSAAWFAADRAPRRAAFTNALRRLRGLGLTRAIAVELLGPPDGSRVRAQYDVGYGGAIIGPHKALILTYDSSDVVTHSMIDR